MFRVLFYGFLLMAIIIAPVIGIIFLKHIVLKIYCGIIIAEFLFLLWLYFLPEEKNLCQP